MAKEEILFPAYGQEQILFTNHGQEQILFMNYAYIHTAERGQEQTSHRSARLV